LQQFLDQQEIFLDLLLQRRVTRWPDQLARVLGGEIEQENGVAEFGPCFDCRPVKRETRLETSATAPSAERRVARLRKRDAFSWNWTTLSILSPPYFGAASPGDERSMAK
jgi:hypothetical protein